MKYVIFASYGNDSIALIQFAHESNLTEESLPDAIAIPAVSDDDEAEAKCSKRHQNEVKSP